MIFDFTQIMLTIALFTAFCCLLACALIRVSERPYGDHADDTSDLEDDWDFEDFDDFDEIEFDLVCLEERVESLEETVRDMKEEGTS